MTSDKPAQLRAIPPLSTPQPVIDLRTEGSSPPIATYFDAKGRLTCPACGSHDFEVADTLPWESGSKRRYRACQGCGLRVRTREIIDE